MVPVYNGRYHKEGSGIGSGGGGRRSLDHVDVTMIELLMVVVVVSVVAVVSELVLLCNHIRIILCK